MKALFIAAAAALAGCAGTVSDEQTVQRAEQVFHGAFTRGNQQMAARVATQDEVQALCTKYRDNPPKEVADQLEKAQQATIKYPATGMMGDWRQGEKIAQDGYGLRFTDPDTKRPNGGNCYACHQLSPKELSFGTLGTSLRGYGKLRGSSDAIQRYTYGKIYNSQAFSACSNMPRFGHNGILTEQQMKDVTALLLDPNSPVNQ
jgi:L-cysteine S-thiosulfotransferase